jgi:amidase
MGIDEPGDLDATAQAALVSSGECSAAELLEATIAGIERVNPKLNAVIIPLFDRAREQVARGELGDGPFRGVPLVLKDLGAALAGTPQYRGTRVLRDRAWVSPRDSELTARFGRAGFVFVGKTNTPELGLSPTTEPDTFGPTRNPWNPDRIVGGSSGGSASAVASRMVSVAHAGDGGGSIRNPAGACGVVGLKPSRGRVTLGPDVGESCSGCVTELVITRSVRDTAAVLDCVHGYFAGDPVTAPPPERPFLQEIGRDPGRLRVGMFVGNPATPGAPEARDAVERCARLLAELGHDVYDGYPPVLESNELASLLGVSVEASVARELAVIEEHTGAPVGPDGVEPATWGFAERGRAMTAIDYVANVEAMHRYSRTLCSWWDEGNDLLVTPTMAEAAPAVGELKGADVERIVRLVPYTSPYNVTGQPGIALPLHWTADNMPVGIQLVAPYGREDLLIRVAAQLEEAAPWRDRVPPIHA